MAILKPFRGVLYDPARVGDLSEVLCPAFDSMTPELHQDLLRRSPYNAARLELIRPGATEPAPEAEYRKAGSLWRRWSADGLLRRDASPCFYLLDEYFRSRCPGGNPKPGFIFKPGRINIIHTVNQIGITATALG